MINNNPPQGLFGNKPPQTNSIFTAPAAQQPNNLFNNPQTTQQNNMLFGQTNTQTQPGIGISIYNIPQVDLDKHHYQDNQLKIKVFLVKHRQLLLIYLETHNQPLDNNLIYLLQSNYLFFYLLFFVQKIIQGKYQLICTTPQQQQPGMIIQNGLQYPQQNQIQTLINDSNAFKEKYNALTLKIGETEKTFINQPAQNQQWQQMIQPISQIVFQIDTKSVLDTSEQILAGQKDLSKNLNEYISTVGLVQKITEDGLEVLKKEEAQCNDYQKAQQTMKESYDQLSGTVRLNQQFSVPQKYQEQLIIQQYEQLERLTTTVNNMIKYYEKQPNMDVDEALQYKLMHLQTLSNYQCMLSSRIRNIQEKISTFQTKTYSQIMPDKKIDEFYTIDTHKDLLDQIIAEKI